jgi:hypothetical protein
MKLIAVLLSASLCIYVLSITPGDVIFDEAEPEEEVQVFDDFGEPKGWEMLPPDHIPYDDDLYLKDEPAD